MRASPARHRFEELCVTQGAVSHRGQGAGSGARHRRCSTANAGAWSSPEPAATTLLSYAMRWTESPLGTERLMQRQRSIGSSGRSAPRRTSPPSGWSAPTGRLFRIPSRNRSANFHATMHHVDLAREAGDLAVRHGDGNWPGHDVMRLSPGAIITRSASPQAPRGVTVWSGPRMSRGFPAPTSTIASARTRWRSKLPAFGRRTPSQGPVAEPRQHGDRCTRSTARE